MNTGDDMCLSITSALAARAVREYEAVAEEFGFEPYGTPAEQAASYNRHLESHQAQIQAEAVKLQQQIDELKLRQRGARK